MTPLEIGMLLFIAGGISIYIGEKINFDVVNIGLCMFLIAVGFLLITAGIGYPLYHYIWVR